MRLTALVNATILVAALVLFGCGRSGPVDQTPSDENVMAAVLSLRWDTVTTAFRSLQSDRVVETQSLEVWHREVPQGRKRTRSEYNNGVVAATATLDSSGTFRSSWTERLVARAPEISVPFEHWLDAEPPYESARRRDDFRFSSLPDTTIGAKTVKRYMVAPRGSDGAITSVVFMATADSNQVVGLREKRTEHAPFFTQSSDLAVTMGRSKGSWVPSSVVLDVTIAAPARAPRRYLVSRSFDRIGPPDSAG